MTKFQIAAYKAHETRRKNAVSARQRKAAFKAHKTMRIAREKRRAAAFKAWETRTGTYTVAIFA